MLSGPLLCPPLSVFVTIPCVSGVCRLDGDAALIDHSLDLRYLIASKTDPRFKGNQNKTFLVSKDIWCVSACGPGREVLLVRLAVSLPSPHLPSPNTQHPPSPCCSYRQPHCHVGRMVPHVVCSAPSALQVYPR